MFTLGVLTSSDMGSVGQREDTSAQAIKEIFLDMDFSLARYEIVPDEQEIISSRLKESCLFLLSLRSASSPAANISICWVVCMAPFQPLIGYCVRITYFKFQYNNSSYALHRCNTSTILSIISLTFPFPNFISILQFLHQFSEQFELEFVFILYLIHRFIFTPRLHFTSSAP